MGSERAKIELETTNIRLSEQLVKLATAQTLQQVAEVRKLLCDMWKKILIFLLHTDRRKGGHGTVGKGKNRT